MAPPSRRPPLDVRAVVITRGRADWAARLLRSLARAARPMQSAGELELSISVEVNGPDELTWRRLLATRAEIVADSARLGLRAPAIEIRAETAALGAPAARNRLLADLPGGGVGQWVFFVDDDAFVGPGYFEALAHAIAARPRAVAIGGPNLTPPGARGFARVTGAVLATKLATVLSSPRYRAEGSVPARCGEESLILCNLHVRRDALERLGRHPFAPGLVCAEENWLLQTLQSRGGELAYAPGLAVWHERRARPAALARQVYRYGYGRGQNLVERPWTLRLAHVVPTLCLAYALAFAVAAPLLELPGAATAPFAAYAAVTALGAIAPARAARAGARGYPLAILALAVVHAFYGAGVGAALARSGWSRLRQRGGRRDVARA